MIKGAPPPDAEEAPFGALSGSRGPPNGVARRSSTTSRRRRRNPPRNEASRERFPFADGDNFESAFERARSAGDPPFAARLEEDRADALAALAALEAEAEAEGDSGADDVPFLHWSAYETEAHETASFEDVLFPVFESTRRSSSVSAKTRTMTEARDEREALGFSPADGSARHGAARRRRRRRRRRARRSPWRGAAWTPAASRLFCAGAWRAARDDDDPSLTDRKSRTTFERLESLESLEESFVSTDIETLESGSAFQTLVDAGARRRRRRRRARARRGAPRGGGGGARARGGGAAADRDPDAERDPFAAAAAAPAARDARFAEAERLSPGSPPATRRPDSRDSDDAKTPALRGSGSGSGSDPAAAGSSEVFFSARAMRRALRDVVSAAEGGASRARVRRRRAVAREGRRGVGSSRRGAGAASRAALRDAASRASDFTDSTSAGRVTASEASDPLACLRSAIEGDETLAALASEAVARREARRSPRASPRCFAAPERRARRALARARSGADLGAARGAPRVPPPRALGRFPQLRALLKAERALARDRRTTPRSARSFVRESRSRATKKKKTGPPRRKPRRCGGARRARTSSTRTSRRSWRNAATGARASLSRQRGVRGARCRCGRATTTPATVQYSKRRRRRRETKTKTTWREKMPSWRFRADTRSTRAASPRRRAWSVCVSARRADAFARAGGAQGGRRGERGVGGVVSFVEGAVVVIEEGIFPADSRF